MHPVHFPRLNLFRNRKENPTGGSHNDSHIYFRLDFPNPNLHIPWVFLLRVVVLIPTHGLPTLWHAETMNLELGCLDACAPSLASHPNLVAGLPNAWLTAPSVLSAEALLAAFWAHSPVCLFLFEGTTAQKGLGEEEVRWTAHSQDQFTEEFKYTGNAPPTSLSTSRGQSLGWAGRLGGSGRGGGSTV